ncbi:uncharacterized protein [Triticum aestivum]|uniref:uncharacterized protein isoform X3 n=1 Tax=Triticum aestivum TaxID=4565 RepID=UPI0008442E57|nr:uncharacterized protein LOC123161014 isoform X3 [Triticum aestivum]
MGSDLNGTRRRHRHSYESYRGTNFKKTRAKVQFADLSEDLLSTILSKLPLKDAVRTGILSSKWKDRWKLYPVDLGDAADLKHAFLDLYTPMTLEYALTILPKVLPSVQDLTLRASFELKMPLWMETPCKFSNLKCLDLRLILNDKEEGNILSLASFLSVAPFVEKLVIYFHVFGFPHRVLEPIKSVPRCPHNHLKNLHITGFSGTTTQLEFLVHVVESAHALEILTIKGSDIVGRRLDHKWIIKFLSLFRELERKYLREIISPNVKLSIISREYRMLEQEKNMNFLAEIQAALLRYATRQRGGQDLGNRMDEELE